MLPRLTIRQPLGSPDWQNAARSNVRLVRWWRPEAPASTVPRKKQSCPVLGHSIISGVKNPRLIHVVAIPSQVLHRERELNAIVHVSQSKYILNQKGSRLERNHQSDERRQQATILGMLETHPLEVSARLGKPLLRPGGAQGRDHLGTELVRPPRSGPLRQQRR